MSVADRNALLGRRPWAIAHRGASLVAPENTLASFRQAMQLGADLIELDVHLSADGQVVVIHDDTVDRTTDGSGAVEQLSLAQLQQLDAGSWMSSAFSGERIPSLRQVLELTRSRAGLAVEIKQGPDRCPGLPAAVVGLLEAADRTDDVIVISKHCAVVQQVRRSNDRIPTSCFGHSSLEWWRTAGQGGCRSDYLFLEPGQVTREVMDEVHAGGLFAVTGLEGLSTVDPEVVRRLARAGVDGIVADDVALLVRCLADWRRATPD